MHSAPPLNHIVMAKLGSKNSRVAQNFSDVTRRRRRASQRAAMPEQHLALKHVEITDLGVDLLQNILLSATTHVNPVRHGAMPSPALLDPPPDDREHIHIPAR